MHLSSIAFVFMSTALALSGCSDKSSEATKSAAEDSAASEASETVKVLASDISSAQAETFTLSLVKTIDGFASPEAVTSDGKFFYVSNVGTELKPTDKDGDGFITKLGDDGTVIEEKFLPKKGQPPLNAPKGMLIEGKTLYVADVDRIVGYNLDTREEIKIIDFSSDGVLFLNDITAIGSGQALVSATDTGTVYQVYLEQGSFSRLALQYPGANGIHFNPENRLLTLVGFGTNNTRNGGLIQATFASDGIKGGLKNIAGGHYDGVYGQGSKLYISEWGAFEAEAGQLLRVDTTTDPATIEVLLRDLSGPARFFVDAGRKQWWIPNMLGNTVAIYEQTAP